MGLTISQMEKLNTVFENANCQAVFRSCQLWLNQINSLNSSFLHLLACLNHTKYSHEERKERYLLLGINLSQQGSFLFSFFFVTSSTALQNGPYRHRAEALRGCRLCERSFVCSINSNHPHSKGWGGGRHCFLQRER